MQKELKIARFAAKSAGDWLWESFNKLHKANIRFKSKHEIFTKQDKGAEKIILDMIQKNFPQHQILSEEKGYNKKKSDYLWVVDPLDGTTNFSIKNPLFGVSIALAYKKEIILGVIYIPFCKELFWAEKDRGANLNGRKIRVSNVRDIKKAFLTYCHGSKLSHFRRAMKAYRVFKLKSYDARRLGSSAVEFSWVACGRTDAIMTPGANSWDVAAGAILVSEARGKVTDFQGRKWGLKSADILASNGKIHRDVSKVLKRI
jgi:myo-inositol-1(or 4)-monophosphatase